MFEAAKSEKATLDDVINEAKKYLKSKDTSNEHVKEQLSKIRKRPF